LHPAQQATALKTGTSNPCQAGRDVEQILYLASIDPKRRKALAT
jgi:hypothetical protein